MTDLDVVAANTFVCRGAYKTSHGTAMGSSRSYPLNVIIQSRRNGSTKVICPYMDSCERCSAPEIDEKEKVLCPYHY